ETQLLPPALILRIAALPVLLLFIAVSCSEKPEVALSPRQTLALPLHDRAGRTHCLVLRAPITAAEQEQHRLQGLLLEIVNCLTFCRRHSAQPTFCKAWPGSCLP